MSLLDIGGSLLGAGIGAYGANAAAGAQAKASKNAMKQQQRAYGSNVLMQEPARNIGYQAYGDIASALGYSMPAYTTANQLMASMNPLSPKQISTMLGQGMTIEQIAQQGTIQSPGKKTMRRLMKAGLTMDQINQLQANRQSPGASTDPTGQTPSGTRDFSRFIDSPDYQFRLNEGTRNVGNSFAARGGALSGNALRAVNDYAQNTAANEYAAWFNRRAALASGGNTAATNIGSAATSTANNMGNLQQAQGDARASGILGTTGAFQGGVLGAAQGAGNLWGQPKVNHMYSNYGPYAGAYKWG